MPSLVLGWLTVELLLKVLAQIGNGSFLKSHHVGVLFLDIPLRFHEEIVRHYEHGMAVGDLEQARVRLLRHLETGRNDFVDGRYIAAT